MGRLLIIGASSDLSKSFISSIEDDDNVKIDILVRDPSKFSKSDSLRFENIYKFDLNKIEELTNFRTESKYSKIIFFQGLDIIKPFSLYNTNEVVQMFNINVLSTITLLNILLSRKNISKEASIVLISSISGITKGTSGHVIYSSSKAALLGLVKSLSLELAKRNIRINCISPGLIQTETLFIKNNQILSKDEKNIYNKKYPLGVGELDSLNGTIKFLLENPSKWITGQNIIVDGGHSNL